MNRWRQYRWQECRWPLAWAIWLVLVFGYLNYRVAPEESIVPEESTPDIVDSTSDIIETMPVDVVIDMNMVSLPKPPPAPGVNEQNTQSRVWLSKLEEGEGPSIVFTWPADSNEREWIQQRLYRCGVRLGKWSNGRLRAIEADTGIGAGTVSGFIRVFSGDVSAQEKSRLQALAGHGQPVRLFPRSLDIHLLTQLSNVTSGQFMRAKHVSAEYERHANGVNISNVQVDGQLVERDVGLLPENGQCS